MPAPGPSNDNGWRPGQPEPGLFSTRKRAIESTLSLIGLALIGAFAWAVLDAAHWRAAGISIAIIAVVSFAAALWRLLRGGRA